MCPVAGNVGRVWLDYARFAQDREKLQNGTKDFYASLGGQCHHTGGSDG